VLVKIVTEAGIWEFVECVHIESNDAAHILLPHWLNDRQAGIFIAVTFPSQPIDVTSSLKLTGVTALLSI